MLENTQQEEITTDDLLLAMQPLIVEAGFLISGYDDAQLQSMLTMLREIDVGQCFSSRIIQCASIDDILEENILQLGDTVLSPTGVYQVQYNGEAHRILNSEQMSQLPQKFIPSTQASTKIININYSPNDDENQIISALNLNQQSSRNALYIANEHGSTAFIFTNFLVSIADLINTEIEQRATNTQREIRTQIRENRPSSTEDSDNDMKPRQ